MSVMTKEEFVREVRGYTLHMYRLAYSILNNSTDAEDAVSQYFFVPLHYDKGRNHSTFEGATSAC